MLRGIYLYIFYPLCAVTFTWWWGGLSTSMTRIAIYIYAGWSFYTPVRATQARQVEG